jgi:hypothetical protein
MKDTAQRMRAILTKQNLNADVLVNAFDLKTLKLMKDACWTLDGLLKIDKMFLTSVDVVAIVMDDLTQLDSNLEAIKTAIKLKELKFERFCFN